MNVLSLLDKLFDELKSSFIPTEKERNGEIYVVYIHMLLTASLHANK